jgi:glutamyl-tRNA reductase
MATDKSLARKHVVVLGMNHQSSAGDLRDRALFSGSRLENGLAALAEKGIVDESLILSTCNRVEIYAVTGRPKHTREELLTWWSEFTEVDRESLRSHTYFYHCGEAVRHLYRVVSSLDSMVIGETQILGQVKGAFTMARDIGNTGTMLNRLFFMAIETGKRVQSETAISEGLVSISSVAVELAQKILGRLKKRSVLILGAGEMSKLTAKHLTSAGVTRLYFANRTRERAVELAASFQGTPLLLRERDTVFPICDMVVSSTGSPHHIITLDEIRGIMARRSNRPLFLIDIAAPRDIDPRVGNLPNVFLYGIDDLSAVVRENTAMRKQEVTVAEEIIEQEFAKYEEWYRSLRVLPTLISLRKRFEEDCERELKRYNSEIGTLTPEAQDIVRRFAVSLTKRFLRSPSRSLRDVAARNEGVDLADAVSDLFELDIDNEE